MDGIEPVFVNSSAFLDAVDFGATDFLVLAVLFIMLYYLIIWEREQGLISLPMTMLRGRSSLMAAKAGVLLLGSLLSNLVFWNCNLLLARKKYGAIDYSAPIQSVEGFRACALSVTIGQYWMMFLRIKITVCFCLAILFLYLASRCSQVQAVWLAAGILFGGSYLFFRAIDGKSALALFKYCNLIPVLNVNALLNYYFNLNMAGRLVAAGWLILLLCVVLFVVFGGLLLLQAKPKYMLNMRQKKVRVRAVREPEPTWGLLTYEAYKSLILQKGLLILCLFVAFHAFTVIRNDTHLTFQEEKYRNYMERLEGPVTDEKRTWIAEERERLDKYNTMLAEAKQQYKNKEISDPEWSAVQQLVSSQANGQEAFLLVEERLAYLDDYRAREGIDPGFVYESGYEYLSGNSYNGSRDDQIHAMLLLTVSILIFASMFSMEYTSGMINLLAVCKKGRHVTVRTKRMLAFIMSLILFITVYLADLIHVIRTYGLPSRSAFCAAVPSMEAYETITLLQYLCMVHLVRFISYLCIVLLFFLVSVLVRNAVKAVMAGILLFVFPLFAALLGITLIDRFTFNMFITGNQYMRIAADGIPLILWIPVILGIVTGVMLPAGFNARFRR